MTKPPNSIKEERKKRNKKRKVLKNNTKANQLNITNFTTPTKSTESSSPDLSAWTSSKAFSNKKREPPTPPDRNIPAKRVNMEGIDNNPIIDDEASDEEELPLELAALRRLLNRDMDKKIRTLRNSISNLEKSQKVLEKKSETIDQIQHENSKLRIDCDQMKKENKKLLNRINLIENRLLENNIILRGIPDQAWELNSITRERLSLQSHILPMGKPLKKNRYHPENKHPKREKDW